jgi:oxepin-CoA hydrolase/3-oxo-5,6-dehydrosuberyl-CoA semialdehyde dehydrogenase
VTSHDPQFVDTVVASIAPGHGRLLVLDRVDAREAAPHGAVLPALIHGGPGRAGGGEELGGIRGVLRLMQATSIAAPPAALVEVTGQWNSYAPQFDSDVHPFRKHFEDLRLGDTLITGTRTITLEDIEAFAALTGDTFYAHTDEEAAAANPFFNGRVAHGYFVISAAAGLFVDPAPGPVLANFGMERLRFVKPVYPGDTIKVRLTCKAKTPRDPGYGEVRWDVAVTNQNDELAATYELLTMNATRSSAV